MITLYVGNLPWATTSEELTAYFSEYGQVVDSRIIKEKETNRSRGFGFVEVVAADAEKMIAKLNGKEFHGRQLIVNQAKPRD
ncbi:MAG TPA: RNA-binding protein [Clostridia bacterium]|jgi:RNA recognition motif-containing protein|nr:RNA-binding protein [Clostridia bacterium]